MTFIYDVVLNFLDEERLINFFEWDQKDFIDHIKQIPIIRISSIQLNDLIKNEIKVDKILLDKIKDKTKLYTKTKDLEYASLFTDLTKVVGIEFNSKGKIISKSSLLIDEEEEILEEANDTKEENIEYKLINNQIKNQYLTRNEMKKQNYLLKELDNLYQENNVDKLEYLYLELYKDDSLSILNKYKKMKKDIEQNYNEKHSKLYDIVRLTYIKNH